jgi:hypothetical protein
VRVQPVCRVITIFDNPASECGLTVILVRVESGAQYDNET